MEGNRRDDRVVGYPGWTGGPATSRSGPSPQAPFYYDYAFGGAVSVVHFASSAPQSWSKSLLNSCIRGNGFKTRPTFLDGPPLKGYCVSS